MRWHLSPHTSQQRCACHLTSLVTAARLYMHICVFPACCVHPPACWNSLRSLGQPPPPLSAAGTVASCCPFLCYDNMLSGLRQAVAWCCIGIGVPILLRVFSVRRALLGLALWLMVPPGAGMWLRTIPFVGWWWVRWRTPPRVILSEMQLNACMQQPPVQLVCLNTVRPSSVFGSASLALVRGRTLASPHATPGVVVVGQQLSPVGVAARAFLWDSFLDLVVKALQCLYHQTGVHHQAEAVD